MGELADPALLVEYAVAADGAGWDGVFLYEDLIWPFAADPDEYEPVADPCITLAGIATSTDHITLGTWVTPVPRRQPWKLARNLATLDYLSDGRVLLGARLDPVVKESGETRKEGGISKKGSSNLRRVLVQCANVAVGTVDDPHFGRFYSRLKRRKNHQVAMVATARKMLVSISHMLDRREVYDPPGVPSKDSFSCGGSLGEEPLQYPQRFVTNEAASTEKSTAFGRFLNPGFEQDSFLQKSY